jgi:hypothetical protein
VKSVAKSLLIAFMGTGAFFMFLMMATVPFLAVLKRLSSNMDRSSVVVSPALFLRSYGLPLAFFFFLAVFVFALFHYRREERHLLRAVHQ